MRAPASRSGEFAYRNAKAGVTAIYTHPHPDPEHVMRAYRTHILSFKRKQNAQRNPPARRVARGLVCYKALVQEYLGAKRLVIARRALMR